ncbi:hypothetical protein ANAPH2_00765 [Anaplasma phagocytophilum]|nr:hypothetical protein ANAPH2_00765 [Anaplasma phagocytophilum]
MGNLNSYDTISPLESKALLATEPDIVEKSIQGLNTEKKQNHSFYLSLLMRGKGCYITISLHRCKPGSIQVAFSRVNSGYNIKQL